MRQHRPKQTVCATGQVGAPQGEILWAVETQSCGQPSQLFLLGKQHTLETKRTRAIIILSADRRRHIEEAVARKKLA